MSEHEKAMGICYPNKCYVEVPTKTEYDAVEDMVNEHEQRLDNITEEVDGALSCESVTTSGTITAAGKINANGGLGVTSLTASGTITSTGKITANGGIGTTTISASGAVTVGGTLTATGKIYANGGIDLASLSTSAITASGLITANGGIKGNLTGNVTGFQFIKGTLQTSSADATYASKAAISITGKNTTNSNISNQCTWNSTYPYTLSVPICSKPSYFRASPGVYVKAADASGTITSTRAVTFSNTYNGAMILAYKLTSASSYTEVTISASSSITLNMAGTYYITYRWTNNNYTTAFTYLTITCPAQTYYIKYATP